MTAQEAERGERFPGAREVLAPDGCHAVTRGGLGGAKQEGGVGADLLLAPGAIGQGSVAAGENFGHALGLADGGDDRPERVVAGAAQADDFAQAAVSSRRAMTALPWLRTRS